jgi:RHH-type proline utilization regulon transcriptional repressor/proline dehydrogenase/delta 1-pyrroline-5-carboxylate dehydrogenase
VRLLDELTDDWAAAIEFLEETDADLITLVRQDTIERLRYAALGRVPAPLLAAAAEAGHWIAGAPVLAEGRIELLWYLREQGISDDYHRYGNLGARAGERRAEPA